MRNRIGILFFTILTSIIMVNQVFCEVLEFTGTIDQVNLKFSTILLLAEQWGGYQAFSTDSKTVISKAGKNITLTELQKGELVIVTYDKKGNKNVAKSIIVKEKITPQGKKGKK